MSQSAYRIALMGMALAAAAPMVAAEAVSSKQAPPPHRKSSGNPSGHMPHQGKREMERRRKRMEKSNA